MRLRVVSLGAGVQSTTMLLMGLDGAFGDVPDCAIFADTGWEPKAVYDHLDWLERAVAPFPVYRVSAGNIRSNTLRQDVRNAQPPLYVLSMGSDRETMIRRQCTKGYKIEPIQRKVREMVGLKPRQRSPKRVVVEQWIGISLDEAQRMKPNPERWIENRWPLIERRLSRHDCLSWLLGRGYPEPPKSACIGCPYHSDHQWRQMRDHDPESWRDAVEFDREIRRVGIRKIEGEPYLHRSLKPLDEVDLSTPEDHGQMVLDGFGAECEGMCGV